MGYSTTTSDSVQPVAKKHNNIFPDKKSPHSRRSLSFSSSLSSSSSSSSYIFPEESPLSPATPLRYFGKPFSWEQLPGVPKKNIHKKKESILDIKRLPLPPPATPPSSKKHHFQHFGSSKKFSTSERFTIKDPFVAALVECSKDDDDDDDDDDDHDQEDSSTSNFWSGSHKIARSISDRFGFVNLYASCKKTCAVSESIVYLPRSTRSSYDLINRRPRRF